MSALPPFCALWPLALLLVLLTGCSSLTLYPRDYALGPSYQPENTFSASPTLPANVRRVAVLPLAADAASAELVDARPVLEPILQAELTKTRKFEVLAVTPEFLRAHTGNWTWGGEEALPADLLEALRQAYACDAVLFCRVTTFRGYAPLAVGWRLRLVELRTASILWAADEVFDAGQPAVSAGARRYQLAELQTAGAAPEEWGIAHCPRQFAQYAAAQALATLPHR